MGLDPGTQSRHWSYIGENAGRFPEGETWHGRSALGDHDILGPAVLLIVLIWLVMRRALRPQQRTDRAGTRDLYREEEQRRREGTDDL